MPTPPMPRERIKLVWLAIKDGMTPSEIAAGLGVTVRHVHGIVGRTIRLEAVVARTRVAESLADDPPDELDFRTVAGRADCRAGERQAARSAFL
jgi:hypothetical protein